MSIDGRIERAIVVPEIGGDSAAKIGVIAAVGLRDALDIEDSDPVRLEIESPDAW